MRGFRNRKQKKRKTDEPAEWHELWRCAAADPVQSSGTALIPGRAVIQKHEWATPDCIFPVFWNRQNEKNLLKGVLAYYIYECIQDATTGNVCNSKGNMLSFRSTFFETANAAPHSAGRKRGKPGVQKPICRGLSSG